MEQGRLPSWHPEAGPPDDGDSKPESEGKKKRRKKDSNRLASLATFGAEGEKERDPKQADRLRKVADFFVERAPSDTPKAGRRKKAAEGQLPVDPEDRVTQGSAGEQANDYHKATIVDGERIVEPSEREREENAEETEGKEFGHEREIPLNALSRGEVIIQLQGDTPLEERIILREQAAEPIVEPEVLESATIEPSELPYKEPMSVHETVFGSLPVPGAELPYETVAESSPVYVMPPIEHAPVYEMPTAPLEQAIDPMEARTPTPRRLEPAEAYRMYMEREVGDRPSGAHPTTYQEEMVTRRSAEDAEYLAAKHAQRSALFTGLFVGALYEHFKHRRRERRDDKRAKDKNRQFQQFRRDQRFYGEEQVKRQAESQRKLESAEDRLASTERRLEERARLDKRARLERQPVIQATPVNHEYPEAAQRLEVPPEHRLEKSAWHTIEVDSRTGKPVEQAAFSYGDEYYKERRQESAVPSTIRNAAAGGLAITGAASTDNSQTQPGASSDDHTLSAATIPNATRQGPPPSPGQSNETGARGPLSSNGPIWPYVLALVVIFICLVYLA